MKELKPRDKITQKMTRDGAVVEVNLTTGETTSVSAKGRRRETMPGATGSLPDSSAATRFCSPLIGPMCREVGQSGHGKGRVRKKPLTQSAARKAPYFPLAVFRSGTGNAGT